MLCAVPFWFLLTGNGDDKKAEGSGDSPELVYDNPTAETTPSASAAAKRV